MVAIEQLSIAGKLRAIAIGAVLGFLIIGWAYFQTLQSHQDSLAIEQQEAEFTRLVSDLNVQIQTLRLNVRSFMLDTSEERLLEQARLLSSIDSTISRLEGNALVAEKYQLMDGLHQTVSSYQSAFSNFELSYRTLGFHENQGLHGKLRRAVHSIEELLKKLNNDQLMRSLLEMRRHEKDFLARTSDKYVNRMNAQAVEFSELVEKTRLYSELKQSVESNMAAYQKTFTEMVKGKKRKEQAVADLEFSETQFDTLLSQLNDAAQIKAEEQRQLIKNLDSSSDWLFSIALAMTAAGVLGITLMVYFSITKPLQMVESIALRFSKGDFTFDIPTDRRDELGKILNAMQSVKQSMSMALGRATEAATSVNSSANELATGNRELAHRTEQQAMALQQTSEHMGEMTKTVRKTASGASEASELASKAQCHATQGGEVSEKAQHAMKEISTASATMADIISVIDDIAFQTNLLALNAAVEAARAGDQGRGFAVVATEVRNLAQRSAASAKEIKDLIDDIVHKVEDGSSLVGQSAESLSEIVDAVKQVTDLIGHIASSSQIQAQGIEEVNNSIHAMEEVTRLNTTQVEEAAVSSRILSEQAEALKNAVSVFQLDMRAAGHHVSPAYHRQSTPKLINASPEQFVERRSADRPWAKQQSSTSAYDSSQHSSDQFVSGRW